MDAADEFHNLTLAIQMTSIMLIAFNIFRQEINTVDNLGKYKANETNVTLRSNEKVTIKFSVVYQIMLDNITSVGLPRTKAGPNDSNYWFGTVKPILTYFASFKSRLDEIRVGTRKMPMGKKLTTQNGERLNLADTVSLSQAGIRSRHFLLCEGVQYEPSRRNALAQSVGPITQILMLLKETRGEYRKKWRKAVEHVQGIEIIKKALEGKKSNEAAGVVGLLGDIDLLAGT